jgi:hypothetical protein
MACPPASSIFFLCLLAKQRRLYDDGPGNSSRTETFLTPSFETSRTTWSSSYSRTQGKKVIDVLVDGRDVDARLIGSEEISTLESVLTQMVWLVFEEPGELLLLLLSGTGITPTTPVASAPALLGAAAPARAGSAHLRYLSSLSYQYPITVTSSSQ